jgi:hypothetical protein
VPRDIVTEVRLISGARRTKPLELPENSRLKGAGLASSLLGLESTLKMDGACRTKAEPMMG